ncbi:hypothetical protein [Nocardia sp. NPDC005745]|uniref:hypothetical protein n=1 Tax=Nocardia sp. NPDC005745 TaxID=3157061 RepID=UPI0033EB0AC7
MGGVVAAFEAGSLSSAIDRADTAAVVDHGRQADNRTRPAHPAHIGNVPETDHREEDS